jgi:hypothetical protein
MAALLAVDLGSLRASTANEAVEIRLHFTELLSKGAIVEKEQFEIYPSWVKPNEIINHPQLRRCVQFECASCSFVLQWSRL